MCWEPGQQPRHSISQHLPCTAGWVALILARHGPAQLPLFPLPHSVYFTTDGGATWQDGLIPSYCIDAASYGCKSFTDSAVMGMAWSGHRGLTVHSHVAANPALQTIYRWVSHQSGHSDWLGQMDVRVGCQGISCMCIMSLTRFWFYLPLSAVLHPPLCIPQQHRELFVLHLRTRLQAQCRQNLMRGKGYLRWPCLLHAFDHEW